jgi:hypothetical protein
VAMGLRRWLGMVTCRSGRRRRRRRRRRGGEPVGCW